MNNLDFCTSDGRTIEVSASSLPHNTFEVMAHYLKRLIKYETDAKGLFIIFFNPIYTIQSGHFIMNQQFYQRILNEFDFFFFE